MSSYIVEDKTVHRIISYLYSLGSFDTSRTNTSDWHDTCLACEEDRYEAMRDNKQMW